MVMDILTNFMWLYGAFGLIVLASQSSMRKTIFFVLLFVTGIGASYLHHQDSDKESEPLPVLYAWVGPV